ncbi:AraC family transcriptional regulator [Niallia circulans]|uniref:AraC family transcriptional regulator n=1 Tax=Niallia circulans TaxID=1397 RepID=UPI001560E92D|nr:AraC family transcriptional regulator [Niallia circulans]NRG31800.1 helix-turn-helix transcriptional regulator [Niallia circulans]
MSFKYFVYTSVQTESLELSFWDIQLSLFSLNNLLESQGIAKDSSYVIAEKVVQFLRENDHLPLTNDTLTAYFNIHENTISKYMKRFYKFTALGYLNSYRLEQARILLLKTDKTILQKNAASHTANTSQASSRKNIAFLL